jgi:hypothetical protein
MHEVAAVIFLFVLVGLVILQRRAPADASSVRDFAVIVIIATIVTLISTF